eukprot:15179-Heterococcus_DN1.PRE.3
MHLMACGLFIVPTIENPEYNFKDKNGIDNDPVGLQYVYGIYVRDSSYLNWLAKTDSKNWLAIEHNALYESTVAVGAGAVTAVIL